MKKPSKKDTVYISLASCGGSSDMNDILGVFRNKSDAAKILAELSHKTDGVDYQEIFKDLMESNSFGYEKDEGFESYYLIEKNVVK